MCGDLARRYRRIRKQQCGEHRRQRFVVTPRLAPETGLARVPRSIRKGNELHDGAVASYEEVSGNLEAAYFVEIGVGTPIQAVAEQLLDLRSPETARRQADPVQDNDARFFTGWALIPVRAPALPRRRYQARIFIGCQLRVDCR